VFAPLDRRGDFSDNAHVALIGIGGLGHLALQFRGTLGCQSRRSRTTLSKAEEGPQLRFAHDVNSCWLIASTRIAYDVSQHQHHFASICGTQCSTHLGALGRLHQLGVVTSHPISLRRCFWSASSRQPPPLAGELAR